MIIFLGIIAVVAFVVAVLMISAIGDPSSDLLSRLYVAVIALLILGAVETQFDRVMSRRRPYSWSEPTRYDRSRLVSLLLFALAAVVLFGCALYLP